MHQDNLGRDLFDQIAKASDFAIELEKHCNWISCIPDSVFKSLLPALKKWHFAPRENHAVAMAFGACMAGKKPAILIQNSGLGLCLDALLGTFRLYNQGILLVISNRGVLSWEEIQHQDWGDITLPLLKASDIPNISFNDEGLPGLARAAKMAQEQKKIVGLIIQRGNLNEDS